MPTANHEYDAIVDELMQLRETFYNAARDAHAGGLPVGRLIGLLGWSNARYILGNEVVDEWEVHVGKTNDRRPKPAQRPSAPRVPGASPMMMAARRSA
jgi:hypothetical protein